MIFKHGLPEARCLRFANAALDAVWDAEHVARVQITTAEDFGLALGGAGHRTDAVVGQEAAVAPATYEMRLSATIAAPAAGGEDGRQR